MSIPIDLPFCSLDEAAQFRSRTSSMETAGAIAPTGTYHADPSPPARLNSALARPYHLELDAAVGG